MNQRYSGAFISNRGHSPTESSVLMALERFKCLNLEQLDYFLPPFKSVNDKYVRSVCWHLFNSKQAVIINNNGVEYIVPPKTYEVDEGIAMSLWVYIDLLKDQKIYSFYRNCPTPKYPSTASFIRDNSVLVSIIPILSAQDLSKILVENDNYTGYDTSLGLKREYILVVRDASVLDDLPKFMPAFPYKIAVVSGNKKDDIKVTYYTVE